LPLDAFSDDFDFDTEIILGLHQADMRIVEVPIPTYYGNEICYVDGLRYARDVSLDVLRYRLRRLGFGPPADSADDAPYLVKDSPHSSHGQLLAWIGERAPTRVLDVGCSDGRFGEQVREQGHQVFGVDLVKHDGVGDRLDGFLEVDLNAGLPVETGDNYGLIVAGDVVEHIIDPTRLLNDMADHLSADGTILASIPNFAHWYPRGRVAIGRFDYDQRGLLDRGHVRFFTRRSFEKLVRSCGLHIVRRDIVGTPFEILDRDSRSPMGRLVRAAARVDRSATRIWPTMFGYQFLYELAPTGAGRSTTTN